MRGLPPNWSQVFAATAAFYHWPPSALDELEVADLLWWHEQALDLQKRTPGG